MTESNPKTNSKSISQKKEDVRIGLYICNCGINIGGILQMDDMIEFGKTLPNVTLCKKYKFYCSDNGQAEIAKDIKDGLINRVVVAACSPRMHEPTFRRVLQENGLNPFYFAQANIREHMGNNKRCYFISSKNILIPYTF